MGIQNFPAALQPIIQQGFLEREFLEGLQSILGYRQIARREGIPVKVGETITKTKPGLKAPVETPMNPANNTNLDNGLTPATWTVEQYTLKMDMYGDTIDLNTVTQGVGIASQFLQNARVNAVQAGQSLDRLARNHLFDTYMGGHTQVVTTLGAPAAALAVDDIRGFRYAFHDGVLTPVSAGNPMKVFVNGVEYTLTSAVADGVNVSKAPKGISGVLNFSGNVSVANGTAGKPVVSDVAPVMIRPGGRATCADLVAGDKLTMSVLLDAVAQLRSNGVPTINGMYNCYLDNFSGRQIFADDDFKQLYRGATNAAQEFRYGRIIELLDVRFIPTTEAFTQKNGAVTIRRPIICGEGSLIEGDFEGSSDLHRAENLVDVIDGIFQVTREPLDRLGQIIAQSWFWIGGFAAPTDQTANTDIIPSATNSYYKRAIIVEHGS